MGSGAFNLRVTGDGQRQQCPGDSADGFNVVSCVRGLRSKQKLLSTLANARTDANFLYTEVKGLQSLVSAPRASRVTESELHYIIQKCAGDIVQQLSDVMAAATVGPAGCEPRVLCGECKGMVKWLHCLESMLKLATSLQTSHGPAGGAHVTP